MSKYQKTLQFYLKLKAFLMSEYFNQEKAEELVQLFEKMNTSGLLTVAKLREAYEDDDSCPKEFAEWVFTDLATHLRDPAAREVVQFFIRQAGSVMEPELYVQWKSVRLLETNPGEKYDGPGVVTVVVGSVKNFHNLFLKDKKSHVGIIHQSFADNAVIPLLASM